MQYINMDNMNQLIVKGKEGSPIRINKDRVSLSQGLFIVIWDPGS